MKYDEYSPEEPSRGDIHGVANDVDAALGLQLQHALANSNSSNVDEMAAAKRVLHEYVRELEPRAPGVGRPEQTPFSDVRISPNELRAGLESVSAAISDAAGSEVRKHFSLLKPTTPADPIFEPHEEVFALALITHGLVASEALAKEGKISSFGVLFDDQTFDGLERRLAAAGYLGDTPERQAATIASVKSKFALSLEAAIRHNFAAPRASNPELDG